MLSVTFMAWPPHIDVRREPGFFKYDDFDTYKLSEIFSTPDENLGSKDQESPGLKAALKERFLTKSFLLR